MVDNNECQWLILMYLPPLQRTVEFTHFRYLIQHMGICFHAIPTFEKESVKIKQTLHLQHIECKSLLNIYKNVWIVLLKKKLKSVPNYDEYEYSFRYFINLYSPWFEEYDTIDFDSVEIEGKERIDVCTYVLDTCDNHSVFNQHLKEYHVNYNKTQKISLYELLEFLIDIKE